jgi:hypothetical protein
MQNQVGMYSWLAKEFRRWLMQVRAGTHSCALPLRSNSGHLGKTDIPALEIMSTEQAQPVNLVYLNPQKIFHPQQAI